MIVATVVEASDAGVRVLSCPAIELAADRGSLVLWPRSASPIRVPFAWIYALGVREL